MCRSFQTFIEHASIQTPPVLFKTYLYTCLHRKGGNGTGNDCTRVLPHVLYSTTFIEHLSHIIHCCTVRNIDCTHAVFDTCHTVYCTKLNILVSNVCTCYTVQKLLYTCHILKHVMLYKIWLYTCACSQRSHCPTFDFSPVHIDTYSTVPILMVNVSSLTRVIR